MKKQILKVLSIGFILFGSSSELNAQLPFNISPSGSVELCLGASVTLQADPLPPGYTYQWIREDYGPGGCGYTIINIPGATNQSYTASQASVYWCSAIDSNGSVADWSMTSAWVTVPGPPINICYYTPLEFCQPGDVELWVNVLWEGNGPTTGVQWQLNGVDIPSATTVPYTATVSGTYRCRVHNSCSSQYTNNVVVTANPRPAASVTAAGPTTFCSGSSVVLNAPVAANRTYQWKKNNVNISGASLSSYIATAAGNYKVIVTNTVTGCSKTTGSATVVTVNAKPAATVTPQGPTTFCAGGSVVLKANTGAGLTYKWKKNNAYISGATLINYTATTAGNYKVEVTNSNGCSKTSTAVTVTVPCREGEMIAEDNFDVKVFPNPSSGEFTIEFSDKPTAAVQIEITDAMGRVVKTFETEDETVVIKETNLANGIYCLTARNKNHVLIRKINILK